MKKFLLVLFISLFCFTVFSADIAALAGETTLMIYALESNLEEMHSILEILSETDTVKSGNWDEMEETISEIQKRDAHTLYWFANTDGTYYTVEKGLTDANLKNRTYFSVLEVGGKVYGAVVTGYTSGKKSAVAALPVIKDDLVVGYIGGSKYTEAFEELLTFFSDNGLDKSVYAITREGEEVFRFNIDDKVATDLGKRMTENTSGLYPSVENSPLKYRYIFGSSPSTGWIYAIGSLK